MKIISQNKKYKLLSMVRKNKDVYNYHTNFMLDINKSIEVIMTNLFSNHFSFLTIRVAHLGITRPE